MKAAVPQPAPRSFRGTCLRSMFPPRGGRKGWGRCHHCEYQRSAAMSGGGSLPRGEAAACCWAEQTFHGVSAGLDQRPPPSPAPNAAFDLSAGRPGSLPTSGRGCPASSFPAVACSGAAAVGATGAGPGPPRCPRLQNGSDGTSAARARAEAGARRRRRVEAAAEPPQTRRDAAGAARCRARCRRAGQAGALRSPTPRTTAPSRRRAGSAGPRRRDARMRGGGGAVG